MKKYWNHGLTTEAARRIIDFGKEVLHQNRFFCCLAKDNPASGRVMMKVGFLYQGDGVYYSFNCEKRFECKEYLLTIR